MCLDKKFNSIDVHMMITLRGYATDTDTTFLQISQEANYQKLLHLECKNEADRTMITTSNIWENIRVVNINVHDGL